MSVFDTRQGLVHGRQSATPAPPSWVPGKMPERKKANLDAGERMKGLDPHEKFMGVAEYGDRVEQEAARLGRTHVVLSFGARNGGALFAQWLRSELMRHFCFKQTNNVYLDTFSLREFYGTKAVILGDKAGGLASMNDAWADYYKNAVRQAHTMIFVATAEWFRSAFCGRELNEYSAENARRRQDGRPTLRGIALRFPGPGTSSAAFGNMLEITAEQRYAVADPAERGKLQGNYRDFWTVDQRVMHRLLPDVRRGEPAGAILAHFDACRAAEKAAAKRDRFLLGLRPGERAEYLTWEATHGAAMGR